ncbi:putative methyltransferase PMT14 [Artemisia annua]|uniref:Putative methyltransferase PMT14 n=1 Tax=Artemisia annua TaxID=35608 RepID=A0A2U1L928_ARTAN|nr:putative methyltransferase PMT14 [Artemisia annua]
MVISATQVGQESRFGGENQRPACCTFVHLDLFTYVTGGETRLNGASGKEHEQTGVGQVDHANLGRNFRRLSALRQKERRLTLKVASWGAYLMKTNVLATSFAPTNNHEEQVSF